MFMNLLRDFQVQSVAAGLLHSACIDGIYVVGAKRYS